MLARINRAYAQVWHQPILDEISVLLSTWNKVVVTHIALHKFGQINIPDLECDGVREQLDTTLIHLSQYLTRISVFVTSKIHSP